MTNATTVTAQENKKVAWRVTDIDFTENQAVIVFDETEKGAKQLAKEQLVKTKAPHENTTDSK
ncbi:hypothetical protein [Zooshikella ganghwensis]|uniref:Uncharacterized protein n=1 Tax=Zooshikella ganghwensis TaxID=202772 RepID=A0A4P9VFM4_9GAMM|nr:hypothetical protein [Zooshikella ganghwensis]RDH41174.1 hypothetical protein B9G39_29655 [Zooshikella ganghwensis]